MKVKYENYYGGIEAKELSEFINDKLNNFSGEGGVVEQVESDVESVKILLVDLVKKLVEKEVLSVQDLAELFDEKSLKEVRENEFS